MAAPSTSPAAKPAIDKPSRPVVESASVVSINSGVAEKVDTPEPAANPTKTVSKQEAPTTAAAPAPMTGQVSAPDTNSAMAEPAATATPASANPTAEPAASSIAPPPIEPAASSVTPPPIEPAASSVTPPPIEPAASSVTPPPAEPARQEPVIENRSKPLPTREDYEAMDAADGRQPPRPNPLSVMSGQPEEDVDEYEFIPLEQTTTLPDEDDKPQAAAASTPAPVTPADDLPTLDPSIKPAPVDNQPEQAGKAAAADYEETQEIDADMKRFEVKQEDSEETEGEFLDTLIEKAETVKEEKSEPAHKKSSYVTESLLR